MESQAQRRDQVIEDGIAPAVINEKQGPEAIQQEISQDNVHERWNSSTINIFRYLETLVAFTIMGINDGSLGVSAPTHAHYTIN